jgi:D-beta-D-heptose 7-phosphate kinase / D-beta-D-heptose 1-phosphate adenosyltransferase
MTRVVVVGDALLDRDIHGHVERLAPDAPAPIVESASVTSRAGGAGLAAAIACDQADVALVTALGSDSAGEELRALLEEKGIEVHDLGCKGETSQKVRVRADGRSLVRVDHGGRTSENIGPVTEVIADVVSSADALLVSDYGRGITARPDVREELAEAAHSGLVVWDPHPRGAMPVPSVRLATPNRSEVAAALGAEIIDDGLSCVAEHATALAQRWKARALAVTLGAKGALLVDGSGSPFVVPARVAPEGDPCGAGDCFASEATLALAQGALPTEAVIQAVNAASTFVARGGAAGFASGQVDSGTVRQAVDRVRRAGGTVVATGGCFDLLHAGHISMLRAARALGDCLVVLLNSDDSVRRIKGPSRPLVPQEDRLAVLASLEDVDEVIIFEEDTPEKALQQLRPDIWAKGADYAVSDLPERKAIESWGGQAVVLPYLDGRSTSALVKEVVQRGN